MSVSLHQRLHDRLLQLHEERPDLTAALDLQRNLLARELELTDVFLAGGLPRLSLPPRYLAAKLGNGIPVLHGEPVPLPQHLLTLAIRDFCERLNTGRTAEAASAIQAAFDGHLDPAAVISACFGRDQHRVRALAEHASVTPDLLWLVADLTVAPLAHLLQRNIFGEAATAAGTPLGDALVRWDHGFCPACGSWPALMEAGDGGHTLRCSFCAMGWTLASYRCVYCGNDGESFLTAAPNPEIPGRRLQLCGECGGYAKVLDLPAPTEFPLVAIEDLASLDLDMAAIERRYGRPVLPTIRKSAGGHSHAAPGHPPASS
ncbi:MAG: formate dehydrogenase accessory protein FdhE [Vicinamibacterales bacterium]|nr:formate dehydrogenase accessory protein FdhE [Vicinamibacterales bacterium]